MKIKFSVAILFVLLLFALTGCTDSFGGNELTKIKDTTMIDSINSSETMASTVTDQFEDTTVTESINETQSSDVLGEETVYEYIDSIEWEYPDNISANTYFYSTSLIFEEGDTVPVDKLIRYYTLCEMMDNKTYDLYEYLLQYKTHSSDSTFNEKYEICIPKKIVNAEIEKHFSVKVDDTDSLYTHPEQSDCYLLVPSAMGGLSVSMSNYSVSGNRTTAIYAVYNSIDKRILEKVELCIENEDSEEDFRIVYARKV